MTVAVTTALTCLLAGAAGCGAGGTGGIAGERSADELLDDANETMRALESVTVRSTTAAAKGGTMTRRFTTDLDSRCTARTTWSEGGTLEQIRIGETDYVRPDRAYLQRWNKSTATGTEQRLWVKTPADAEPTDGLVSCAWPFDSFGTATKGKTTRVDGRKAVEVKVTDKAVKEGTYTFYVAGEGRPYLLRTTYEGSDFRTVTSFSGFDEPMDVRPPKPAEVLSASGPASG
ncbi:hypothetical protein [Streptomyces bullii]|uniref:Lipoprotein n=1 Tax=Streptomyces bullii TaxID=349910 RepID=A0ABW0UZ81_9ACTN